MRRLGPAFIGMVLLMLLGCAPRADGASGRATDTAFPLRRVVDVPVEVAGASVEDTALAVPDLGTVYASATGANQVAVIDVRPLTIIARIPGGTYPDGIAYDPVEHKIFVSDETGGTDTVIDLRTNTRVATIDLGGEVGNTQYDPVSRRIFADVQTRNDLVAIDPVADRIVDRYPLQGCQHDHGLLLDGARRLAFVVCDGNAKLLVVDLRSMRVRSVFPVGQDPDVLAFDEGLHRLYVSSESGWLACFKSVAAIL